jgi:hypothetical protein
MAATFYEVVKRAIFEQLARANEKKSLAHFGDLLKRCR